MLEAFVRRHTEKRPEYSTPEVTMRFEPSVYDGSNWPVLPSPLWYL